MTSLDKSKQIHNQPIKLRSVGVYILLGPIKMRIRYKIENILSWNVVC